MHTVHQVSQFIPPPPSDIPNQYFPQVPLVVANFPTFGYFRLFLRKVTALKNSNFLYIISQLFLTPGKIPPPSVLFLFRSRSPALPLEMSLIWRIPSRQAAHPTNRKPGFQAPSWKWVFDQSKNRIEVWMIEACG